MMKKIIVKYEEFHKHRMPQYRQYGDYEIIPQEEEREIWLRIPVEISSDTFSISFFIKSIIDINEISSFEKIEDAAYFISVTSFTERLSKTPQWDVLSMVDIHPMYGFDTNLLDDELPNDLPYKFEIQIDESFGEYLEKVYQEKVKAVEAFHICEENLAKMVSSPSASGFKYIEGEIRQYLNFLDRCSRNMSTHCHKTHYFRKNLRKIERGFGELIKRKQVSHPNYQYHLEETRTAIYHLSLSDAWDGRIPSAPKLPTY